MGKTLVVNLYGGPGTGKSTMASKIFAKLKDEGVNCELVTEFAKDLVWSHRHKCLEDQIYIFANQLHRVKRLLGTVDVVISDSPILLSLVFAKNESREFKDLVGREQSSMDTLDIFLERSKDYKKIGRRETEKEAIALDAEIKQYCEFTFPTDGYSDDLIVDLIKAKIR